MTIRDIVVAFGFDVDRNSERDAENRIKGVANLAKSLLGAIGIGFSIAGIAGLAEAAADAEALESQFSQVFTDMETEAERRLQAIEEDTGVMVNRMKGSFSGITAFAKVSGVEQADALELADRAMVAVADSAAYYDRSIEQVTESLQSFLKGNYENDAALGLSATETTRNAAANDLYGKSFKDLSEAEKQFTLLKMVEDANAASGALGQAARESDTWTNQLGNLKQSLQDLKATAGAGYLKPAVEVLKGLISLTQKAKEKIAEATDENGILTRSFDRFYALVKVLRPALERTLQSLFLGASKGKETVKEVVDRLGGMENVLKLVAVAAGAFFAVMAYAKAVSTVKNLYKAWKEVDKVLLSAKLKVLGLVAVLVIIALIVEDFVNFMMGNDSVIGSMFDRAGIGADNAREAIFGAFGKIRDFLMSIWELIEPRLPEILESLSTAASAIGSALSAVFQALYGAVSAVFQALLTLIKMVFGWMLAFWNSWGAQILDWFSGLWGYAENILNDFLALIIAFANFIEAVFTGDWQAAWDAVKRILAAAWDMIVNWLSSGWDTLKLLFAMGLAALSSVWESVWSGISSFFMSIWTSIVSFLGGILDNIWNSITSKVSGIKDTVIDGFKAAVDYIKGLPAEAIQWGADMVSGIVDGIMSKVGAVTDGVKRVGEKIRSFLHFSVPDEGPLADYESWMPDFMSGLADGIQANEGLVLDRVRSLADGISMLMQAATAQTATAANSTINHMSSSVTQNVNISNSYSGGPMDAQRNVSKAMKRSASDATTYMARGLRYARG